MTTTTADDNSQPISDDEALDALERVLASQGFDKADRLKELLGYVVRQHVHEPGRPILGKQIAADVYGRRAGSDDSSVGVVRVDVSRLRRRLAVYYLDEGAEDPVTINIDKGRYAPRFARPSEEDTELPPSEATEPAAQTDISFQMRPIHWGLGVVGVSVLGVFLWFQSGSDEDASRPGSSTYPNSAAREALFEVSPASLQAVNLAQQGRGMLFPATQPDRLRAALVLFEKAIELDPDYFGGYAGAAQASAMYGGLAPLGEKREEMLENARRRAQAAIKLGPTEAWAHSSMGFLNMFERNFDEATRLSNRAVSLAPTDLAALEIDSIIAFFAGDFERALQNSAPEIHKARVGVGLPWKNVHGNALFYMAEYELSIAMLYDAAASGGPVSKINSAHLIAAMQAAGRTREAARLMAEFEDVWPESGIAELMHRLFKDPENAQKLIGQLEAAGWHGR